MNTNQLTFTRFIAALFIVIYHFASSLFIIENDFIKVQREFLNLGVGYFYVLSGFVMMLAYGDKEKINKKDYWINRVARVYPLHIFTLLLTIIVSLLISVNYLEYYDFNIKSFLINALLIQSWIPEYSLSWNVPSWSVSVEMFFYFTFPFIYNFVIKKLSIVKIGVIFFIFWAISQIGMSMFYHSTSYGGYQSLDRYFLYYNPFLHFSTFLIGLWFGKFFKENYTKLVGNYDVLIFVVFALCTILVYLLKDQFLHNGLLAIPFAFLISLVALNTGRLTKLFNKKAFIYLGEISFAMYLLQNPIYIALRKVFKVIGLSDNGYLIFFVGLIVLIIASHLTYRFIEIPMKNRIRKLKWY
ncbi:acyltransferase family protein [Empedobacter falsenii]|uniref:acyltransferase family protein n=1 Tax=Empedobacter falsenii TaxID=343874 RepID=UPI001C566299|nr:acyltransferase [Empedobacter falsenii]MBW1619332.1 acyltransferase [Empedobacter falsenii]